MPKLTNKMTKDTGYTHGYSQAAFNSHQSRTAETEAAFILSHIKPHFRILDFGCGPGTITSSLAKYVPQGQVIGVDISFKAIAQARRNAAEFPDGCPDNLRFYCIDVLEQPNNINASNTDGSSEATRGRAYPFDGEEHPGELPREWLETFDIIYGSTTIVHLPTPTEAIKNLKQFLNPDTGLFATRDIDVWTMMYSPDPTGHLARVGEVLQKLARAGSGNTSSHLARDVPGWLAQAGFPQERMVISAGAIEHTTPEARAWWGNTMSTRFDMGDSIREGVIRRGILNEEECDQVRDSIIKWSKDMIGLYFCAAVQVLAPIK